MSDPILQAIEFLREDVKAVDGRLEAHRKEVSSKLDVGTRFMSQLSERERERNENDRERNGQIGRLTKWKEEMELADAKAASFAQGEQAVRLAARTRVTAIWEKVEKPVVYGAGMLVFGAGIRVGAFLLGNVAW